MERAADPAPPLWGHCRNCAALLGNADRQSRLAGDHNRASFAGGANRWGCLLIDRPGRTDRNLAHSRDGPHYQWHCYRDRGGATRAISFTYPNSLSSSRLVFRSLPDGAIRRLFCQSRLDRDARSFRQAAGDGRGACSVATSREQSRFQSPGQGITEDQETVKTAAAILAAETEAVEDLCAGRPAPYHFGSEPLQQSAQSPRSSKSKDAPRNKTKSPPENSVLEARPPGPRVAVVFAPHGAPAR